MATLSGSYSSVTGTPVQSGFVWGTSADALNNTYIGSCAPAFTGLLKNLHNETTYYYKAYTTVKGTGSYSETRQTFYGGVESFTTQTSLVPTGWLELPAAQTASNLINGSFSTANGRNYSYCYDTDWYAAHWEAYPLTYAHTQGSASGHTWQYNPNIENNRQVNLNGSKSYNTNYDREDLAKGHLVPNADRKSDDDMNRHTYYLTNQVPMVQAKFNAGIWSSLENGVRSIVSSMTDTVYVAVGPCYRTVGGNETVTYLTATDDSVNPRELAIPNYCWKALLKVKRSGREIVDACAVAIWLPHKEYENDSYSNYTISIDQLETKTGIDFFANLPDTVEALAEQNSSWAEFAGFGN